MTIRFCCPACLRKTIQSEVFQHATTVTTKTCPKCKAKWRFVIRPTPFLGDGTIFRIENSNRLN